MDALNGVYESGLARALAQSGRGMKVRQWHGFTRLSEGLLRPGFVSHPLTYIIYNLQVALPLLPAKFLPAKFLIVINPMPVGSNRAQFPGGPPSLTFGPARST